MMAHGQDRMTDRPLALKDEPSPVIFDERATSFAVISPNRGIVMLRQLGSHDSVAGDDAVAILVGLSGAGKSIHLKKIALEYRHKRGVSVISTTIYDRFSGMRGVADFSA